MDVTENKRVTVNPTVEADVVFLFNEHYGCPVKKESVNSTLH